MRIQIDTDRATLLIEDRESRQELGLYTPEAFAVLSRHWVRVGWALKDSYGFSWMGRPVIQLPQDLVRIQEVISEVRPDVIIETGVARGGSLIFYASLCKAFGRGRVFGIDIEIRPANRRAIEAHELSPLITLVEGSSVDPAVVQRVKSLVQPSERALVILDSCHTKAHVLAELEAYHDLVAPGSYIVATDGIMRDLHDVPGGRPEWQVDHPCAAALEFAANHPEFVLDDPPRPFNERLHASDVTYWPQAWLRRIR